MELDAARTVAGYLVWFGLVAGRVALAGTRPSAAWAVAATAAGALVCSQVLVYELLLFAVAVPWLRDLFAAGWRIRGWLAVALLAVQMLPQARMEAIGVAAQRPLAVALFAVLVLVGPVAPGKRR